MTTFFSVPTTKTFKSDLTGDKRRFKFEINESNGFAALYEKLVAMYGVGDLVCKYEDDEHDLITLVTDEDLVEALCMPEPLKLTVFAKSAPPQQPDGAASPTPTAALPEVVPEIMRQQLWFMKHFKKQAKVPGPRAVPCQASQPSTNFGNPVKQMARFIEHVTLSEGEQVPVGETRKKVWRVRNDSPNTWPQGSKLVYVSGKSCDQLSAADSFPVAVALAPGQQADLEVEVVAPPKPGFYQGFWRLQGPKGRKFGQRLGCSMQVSENGDAVISSSESSGEEDSDSDGFIDVGDHSAKVKKADGATWKAKKAKKMGKPCPPNPKDPTSADLWLPERAELRARGYANEGLVLKMLWKCNGNVEAAAAKLADKRIKLEGRVNKVLAKIATLSTTPDAASPLADAVATAAPMGKLCE